MKLQIIERTFPTPDSVTLRFKPDKTLEHYKPGQHGVFTFNVNGENITRTYSFHTVSGFDPDPSITIRAVEDGKVSTFVRSNEIEQVGLEKITGSFYVEPSGETQRHLVMFAGGSGITPIMAMIRAILLNERRSSISLIYSNRDFASIIFRRELAQLESEFPHRLKILHVLTRETNIPADFRVFCRGRLSRLVVRKLLKAIHAEITYATEYYLCGPFQFMELIRDSMTSLNIDSAQIHQENFFIPETSGTSLDISTLLPREVIVKFPDEEKLLLVDAGKSILQAALESNLKVTYSCTEGQCGMCRALLLSGEVKLRKNHVLTEEELKRGEILLCQGFPLSDQVSVSPVN